MSWLERSWTRPEPTRAQLRNDVVLGLAAAVVSLASVEVYRSASGAALGWKGVEAYVWFTVAGLLLAGRRRFPLTTLVAESAVFIALGERLLELGVVFTVQMIMFAALYSAWAWSGRPRALAAVTMAVLVAMFGWLGISFTREAMFPDVETPGLLPPAAALIIYSLAINVVYFAGAIAWGQAAWQSARRRAQVEQQMAAERHRQDEERRGAVQAERVRIARDLHDVVAHHVSGIGVQAAGASRLLETRPDAARTALGRIEASSRRAVAQMHQLVGLLRGPDEERSFDRGPQPGLADLPGLAADTADLEVDLRVVGASFEVDPTVGLSLFRIAQEALTNVRRHSSARAATLTLRWLRDDDRPRAVEVEVLDEGPPRPGSARGGGYGLAGIRERAATHDGEVEIGPRPQGGFRVRVRVGAGQEES